MKVKESLVKQFPILSFPLKTLKKHNLDFYCGNSTAKIKLLFLSNLYYLPVIDVILNDI